MNADATRTVHFRLARTRLGDLSEGEDRVQQLEHAVRQETDPELRDHYLLAVLIAWLRLSFGCALALIVTGFPTRWLLGPPAADIPISIWTPLGFFCVAGACNVVWRYYTFVPQARRRARRHGVGSEPFAVAMRRSLPRDSSLIWQAAVGVLAFVITLSST